MKSSPRTTPKPTNKVLFTTTPRPPRIGPSPAIGMLFSRRKGSIRGKYFENLRDANDGPQGGLVQLLAANFRDRHVPHFLECASKAKTAIFRKSTCKKFWFQPGVAAVDTAFGLLLTFASGV